jgi:hypothetical protein
VSGVNRRRRTGERIALWCLAPGVLGLSACSAAATQPSASRSSRTTLPPTTLSACATSGLAIFGGRQSGGFVGNAQGTVVVTNTSSSACKLEASPTIGLVGTEGILPVQQVPGVSLSPVTLAPGASASFTIDWANWCQSDPGTTQISLGFPDGSSVRGPFDGPPNSNFVPGCLNATQASTVSLVRGYQRGVS